MMTTRAKSIRLFLSSNRPLLVVEHINFLTRRTCEDTGGHGGRGKGSRRAYPFAGADARRTLPSSRNVIGGSVVAEIPGKAQVVIIGGGIVECSIAYHLTLRGLTDVVLLERRQLTCGTTWHAAGLVGQLRATHNLTRLAQYTTELYASLEKESGQATGFKQIGSLALA